jgi:hypothetical protein
MPLNSSSITKLKLPTFPFINCLTGVRYFKSSGHETALERVGLVKQLANRSSGHWRNDGRKIERQGCGAGEDLTCARCGGLVLCESWCESVNANVR